MKYPWLANWVRIKKKSGGEYIAVDMLSEEEYVLDSYTAWFAKQLNGKRDPYTIDSDLSEAEVSNLLNDLDEKYLLRQSRCVSLSLSEIILTVWVPHITPKLRIAAYIINLLLLLSWIPMLCFSVYYFLSSTADINTDFIVLGSTAGILLGIVLHELGHMFACLAYGGMVLELGVSLDYLFLLGAYTLTEESRIKGRMRHIQLGAAGIEMNLLLGAVSLILSVQLESLSGFFWGSAFGNALIGLLNLTFINNFDGMGILAKIFGIDDLPDKVKRITKNRKARKQLLSKGINGKATVAFCYILRSVQVALPIFVLINIIGVISWFL